MNLLPARLMFRSATSRHSIAGQFLRETRGDTALEFAMIGAALFLFIFAIFAISLDMYWQMTLDDAVRNVTRQVQSGGITTSTAFATAVCNEFGVTAPNCMGSLKYSVQSSTAFANITPAILSSSGTLSPSGTFSVTLSTSGSAANGSVKAVTAVPQFLLVQVAYLVPIKIFAVPAGVATENGTPALLSSVAAVMEPKSNGN